MSKRRQLGSPEASGVTESLTDDGQAPMPHSGASKSSLLSLPRELRNMIYDEVLGCTIRPDIRHENQTTEAELKRIRLGRAMQMEDGTHTEIAMQPAYYKDMAPLLLVNHQINAEFSETKKPRPHLFITVHWSPPYGFGKSDESAERTHCWSGSIDTDSWSDRSDADSWCVLDDRIYYKLEYIQVRFTEDLVPRVCTLRIHPEWQTVGGFTVLVGRVNVQVADFLFSLSESIHNLDELNIELVLGEASILEWLNRFTNPGLGEFVAIEPILAWALIEKGGVPMQRLRKTVLTDTNVVIARTEMTFSEESFQQESYEHPDWSQSRGWRNGAKYGTCFFNLEGRQPPVSEKRFGEESSGEESS